MSVHEIETVQEPRLSPEGPEGPRRLRASGGPMVKCGYPSCADPEDDPAALLALRSRRTAPAPSAGTRLKNLLMYLLGLWKTYRNDAYYRSLARGTLYFLFGLKLFRDLAIHLTEDVCEN